MNLKRLLLIYLTAYLFMGGLAYAFFPQLAFKLFRSNGDYGDIMPRVAGMFMMALGGFVGMVTYHKDYKYYGYSIAARTFIVLFLFWIYSKSSDRMFLILNAIVLIGLIPSYIVFINERIKKK